MPIAKSIATKLLVAVFSVYVVITIALTGLHMLAEYRNAKHSVLQEIVALAVTFNPGLATAIYNVDSEGIKSMVQGMVLDPNVTGAVVHTEYQGVFREGDTPDEDVEFKERRIPGLPQVEVEGFSATIPIHYQETEGEGFDIGLLTLYSSESVVLSKVWFALGIILVNAVIKTVALWIIFLWFSRRYLARPLARLTEATTRVRMDDLENSKVDLPSDGEDELRVLARTFNAMIDTLSAARNEEQRLHKDLLEAKLKLEEYSRTLEQRVEQRTEELREAKEAAEKATAVKSSFLANMSHEIRSPMNVVLGMTDLMEESKLDDEQRELLRIQRRGGENLLRLIDDILDLSKVEAGQVELEHIPFDLRDMSEALCKGEAMKAHAKGVELVCRVARDVYPHVIGDPTRLGQVLQNLVGNAVKFTDSGEVRLDISRLEDGRLRFEISDTGIGISEDKLDTIFTSFAQADSSTTRKYGGTGLGLSISRQLVQLMGGTISVRSEQGRGACFSFEIEMEHGEPWSLPALEPDLQGRNVVVVERNKSTRAVIREIVHNWGGQAHEAASAEDFFEVLKRLERAPERIIVGNELAEGSGLDLLAELEADLRAHAVLLARTNSLSDVRARAATMGVRVLVKPIGQNDLREALCPSCVGDIGEGGHA